MTIYNSCGKTNYQEKVRQSFPVLYAPNELHPRASHTILRHKTHAGNVLLATFQKLGCRFPMKMSLSSNREWT